MNSVKGTNRKERTLLSLHQKNKPNFCVEGKLAEGECTSQLLVAHGILYVLQAAQT